MGEHEMLFWGVIAVMFLLVLALSIIQKIETRKKREPSLQARLAQANREADVLLERARKDAKNSPSMGETKWGGL